ncbi:hypothetical protein Tco_0041212, partial [Tanacetum coccineum]
GLRVANSHNGNHPKDDFTPFETIRRSNSTIGKKIPFELKREAFEVGRRSWRRDEDTSSAFDLRVPK